MIAIHGTVRLAVSLPHPPRVEAKIEITSLGRNVRVVVTNRADVFAWYNRRGAAENCIKDLKNGPYLASASQARRGVREQGIMTTRPLIRTTRGTKSSIATSGHFGAGQLAFEWIHWVSVSPCRYSSSCFVKRFLRR